MVSSDPDQELPADRRVQFGEPVNAPSRARAEERAKRTHSLQLCSDCELCHRATNAETQPVRRNSGGLVKPFKHQWLEVRLLIGSWLYVGHTRLPEVSRQLYTNINQT